MTLRKVVPIVLLAALVVAGVVLLLSSREAPPSYKVELDNAFGLTESADLRVAGVKVGQVSKLDVDRKTARAVVTMEVTRTAFGTLR